jgi:hypothetical protein
MLMLVAFVLAPVPAMADPAMPRFAEDSAEAGLATRYEGDWQYMVGGGAASFDCDGDRRPDLFLSGGAAPAGLYRNQSEVGGPLRFRAEVSGLEVDAVLGAYPFDADGDGNTDLLLLRLGENQLMRGEGNCRFSRANEVWGFDGGDAWSAAAAITWERGAAWPTLAVGNYVDRKEEAFPWGSCTPNWLHRPDASGAARFAAPLPLKPSFCALSLLFTDWNRSGTPALRVSNDREYYKGGQEQLWHLDPGAPPRLYAEAEGWKRLRIWGMGIASRDITLDGYPEFFLTSMADNKLQTLATPPADAPRPLRPEYSDIAFARGVTAHRPYTGDDLSPSTAWHAQFEDVNNDGLADLFVAKGNVAEMPDFAAKDPNNLLIQTIEGRFVEAGEVAGVASFATARGGIVTDFNLDGLMDIVAVNRWEGAQIWRNTSEGAGNWVQLELLQDDANRNGIGAFVEIRRGDRVETREITLGGGHASGHLGWWHLGLGPARTAEVRVIWPDGSEGPWETLEGGAFWTLARGQTAQRWTPGAD